MDDPVMAEFVGALGEINALAEQSSGFVWRLKDVSGAATSIHAFPDPRVLVNLSVWSDVLTLQHYVFRTMHGRFFARQKTRFEEFDGAHVALWWIPAGHVPSVEEAKERLAIMTVRGPSAEAFTFREAYPAPQSPGGTLGFGVPVFSCTRSIRLKGWRRARSRPVVGRPTVGSCFAVQPS